MGLYEIHCHTGEVSVCGRVDAERVVLLHKEAGYEGICITDHYYDGYFEKNSPLSDGDIVDRYLQGYRKAAAFGKKIGLKVFLGMELRFTENPNDYLVFGMTEEMINSNPRMFEMGLKAFSETYKDKGILLIQAHPFRDHMIPANPLFLDGIEAINANPRHDAKNHMAAAYADTHGLIKTAGSDYHQECDIALAAIDFERTLNDAGDMILALRNREYKIVG
ncbi:MAG: PHP domain-containing protein [Clostridia bacterium]|nr:PHP domain-containing protein [Clostridia bacterium]